MDNFVPCRPSYYFWVKSRSTLAMFVLIGLMISLLSGCANHDMHKAVAVDSLDAASLTKAYADNAVRADESYKGEIIAVTGEVSSVDNVLGSPTVMLKGSGSEPVQCNFESADGLADLSVGRTVTIKGRCVGNAVWVGMSDCVLE